MAIYVLTLTSLFNGEAANPFTNVFTYVTSSETANNDQAALLADNFEDLFFVDNVSLLTLLNAVMTFTTIEVKSPFEPTVLVQNFIDYDGISTGSYMPKYNVFEWQSDRTRVDIRRGFKRFGVMSEGTVVNGVIESGAVADALEVSTRLGTEINIGGGSSALPCIVKRIKYTAPSGKPAYRLPVDNSETVVSLALDWTYTRVTTQNSRKR